MSVRDEFPELALAELPSSDAEKALLEAERLLPELTLRCGAARLMQAPLACYPDIITLLRIEWEAVRDQDPGATTRRVVYALRAAGRVWPIDADGHAIAAFHRLISPRLAHDEGLRAYVCFRTAFLGRDADAVTPDGRPTELIADAASVEREESRDGSARFTVRIALRPPDGAAPAPESWHAVRGRVLDDGTFMLATEGLPLTSASDADAAPAWRSATPTATPAPASLRWRAPQPDDPDGLSPAVIRRVLEATTLAEELETGVATPLTTEIAPIDRVTVRIAALPFFRNVRLLQCCDPDAPGDLWHGTWYLLVRAGRNGDAPDVHPLDGTSAPLHDVAALRTGEESELLLTDETAGHYLEFFCWAVSGSEGAFIFPRDAADLPITRRPPRLDAEELDRQLLWAQEVTIPKLRAPRRAPAPWRFDTLLGYGNALFRAVMTVHPDGLADMEDDEPLIANLPMTTSKAGATGGGRLTRRPVAPAGDEAAGDQADTARAALPWPETRRDPLVVREQRIEDPLPEAVEEALRERRPVRFEDCTFASSLELAGRSLSALAFVRCEFVPATGRTALELDDAIIDGTLLLQRCVISGDVLLRRISCNGRVRIRGCTLLARDESRPPRPRTLAMLGLPFEFDTDTQRRQAFHIRLDEARIRSSAEIGLCPGLEHGPRSNAAAVFQLAESRVRDARLTECEKLVLEGAHIDGELDLTGLSTRRLLLGNLILQGSLRATLLRLKDGGLDFHARFGWVVATGAKVSGDVTLSRVRVDDDLLLDGCEVKGGLALQRTLIEGALALQHATVLGSIQLDGAEVRRDVMLHFATLPGYLTARSQVALSIGGDLGFSGATLGFVECRAVQVRGDVYAANASVTRLTLGPGVGRHASGGARWPTPSRIGGLWLEHVQVHGHLDLGGTSFTGKPRQQATPAETLRWTDDDAAVVRLSNVTVAGDLRFAHTRNARDLAESIVEEVDRGAPWRWRRPPRRDGTGDSPPASRPTAAIMDVDTGWQPGIGNLEAYVEGSLQVRACRIGGHLDLRSTIVDGVIDATATQVSLDIKCGAVLEDPIRGLRARLRTVASGLVLEGISCGGSLDLTGALVKDRRSSTRLPRSVREDGSIRARGAQVTGNLLLEPVDAVLARTGLHARIEGELDLSALRANRIVLSSRVFGESGVGPQRALLERSHVSRLDIRSPVPALDLTAITVEKWELGELEAVAEATDGEADRYIAVLRSMTPLDRSVWVQVERGLRNGAQDDDANRVYAAMRKEARRLRDGRARSLLDAAYGLVLGYGTKPLRPLVISAAGAFWLLVTLANPSHVVLADDAVGALGLRCRADAPLARAETCATYAREAARSGFQVQLSARALGEEWTLRDHAALTLRYAVPIISITTDSDWVPAEARTLRVPGTSWTTSPKALAFYLALYNWIAIPIALGFFSARLLRS